MSARHQLRWSTGWTLALVATGLVESGAARSRDMDALAVLEEARLNAPVVTASGTMAVSVDVDGDTAVVGSPLDRSAYVYARSGNTWTLETTLTAKGRHDFDYFGWAVAIDGDTIAVGAFRDLDDQGSVSVFSRTKNGWAREAKLTASDGLPGDRFGVSVAVSGDTLVVGADSDFSTFPDQGSAYVFTRVGKKWIEQAKLISSEPHVQALFGESVAIDGDIVVVGAFQDSVVRDNVVYGDQGAAYVFVRSGTSWTQEARLTPSDGGFRDFFGVSVAVHGNTAVVGAYHSNVGQNVEQGAAYVYTRSGTIWVEEAKLTALAGGPEANFGISVAIQGDTVAVGAWLEDVGGTTNQGAVYMFARSGTTWTEQLTLTASDAAAWDTFGRSVAIDGDTLVVGSPQAKVDGDIPEGAAYVFRGIQ